MVSKFKIQKEKFLIKIKLKNEYSNETYEMNFVHGECFVFFFRFVQNKILKVNDE